MSDDIDLDKETRSPGASSIARIPLDDIVISDDEIDSVRKSLDSISTLFTKRSLRALTAAMKFSLEAAKEDDIVDWLAKYALENASSEDIRKHIYKIDTNVFKLYNHLVDGGGMDTYVYVKPTYFFDGKYVDHVKKTVNSKYKSKYKIVEIEKAFGVCSITNKFDFFDYSIEDHSEILSKLPHLKHLVIFSYQTMQHMIIDASIIDIILREEKENPLYETAA